MHDAILLLVQVLAFGVILGCRLTMVGPVSRRANIFMLAAMTWAAAWACWHGSRLLDSAQ